MNTKGYEWTRMGACKDESVYFIRVAYCLNRDLGRLDDLEDYN